jgi:MtrB/PioB family decaheme-associated outer membrane protein
MTPAFHYLHVNGDQSGAEQYRDLDATMAFEDFSLSGGKEDFYFKFSGKDIAQKDQTFFGELGEYGKYGVMIDWQETPRNSPQGTFLGTLMPGGYWSIADATQATLESNFSPLNEQPTNIEQDILNSFLASANKIDLQVQRKEGTLGATYSPIKDLDLQVGFKSSTKEGMRTISTGGYTRSKSGATSLGGLGESFRLFGQEIPGLVDQKTQTINLGMQYSKDTWFTDFSYRFVSFDNLAETVSWDNPLLLNSQNLPGGSPINLLAQAPDYQSSNFSFTGGMSNLPLRSRFTATLSQDTVTQDEQFVPYTINTGVLDTAGNAAATRIMPATSLDGEVITTLINLVLNSNPLPKTTVNLRYKSYDYENNSQRINWDGWVGIGETVWKDFDYVNRVPEYKKTQFGLDGTYRFSPIIKLKAELYQVGYVRNDHRSADNKEDVASAKIQITPSDWALMRFGYRHQDRVIDGEYDAEIELSHARENTYMFDMSDRKRQSFDAYLGLDPYDNLNIGMSLTYTDDDYEKEDIYGLKTAESLLLGVDFGYRISEATHLSAYYSKDINDSNQLNRAKSDGEGNGSFTVLENDWMTDLGDSTDSVGFTLDSVLVRDKLDMSLALNYSSGRGTYDTSNTNYVNGVTTTGATAQLWPDLKSDMLEFKAQFDYHWSEKLTTGLRYYYSKLDLDDFALDNVSTYSGNSIDTQGNSLSHFIFMDSVSGDYESHFVALTLGYTF